jgi:hypothetical protein
MVCVRVDEANGVKCKPRPSGERNLILMRDENRFQRVTNLTPIEAIRAWLNGEFGIYDEPAIIAVIRKDLKIKLSDDEIMEFLFKAIVEDWDAQRCLDELVNRRMTTSIVQKGTPGPGPTGQ